MEDGNIPGDQRGLIVSPFISTRTYRIAGGV